MDAIAQLSPDPRARLSVKAQCFADFAARVSDGDNVAPQIE
jgi:hypothetical protein